MGRKKGGENMNIAVQSLRFDADKKLVDFIENRIEKLSQVAPDMLGADVTLRLENVDHDENKIAEIKIEIPGNSDIFAKKQAKSFEEAVDQTSQALRRQLRKYKEKQRQK
jgi:putative sigma-54 modulation protein